MANALIHTCPNCGALIDVSEVEPFTNIACPTCNAEMRVRSRFDHFELEEYIASGGMGAVYRARDVNLNRVVALKLLRKEFSADAEQIARLETEAKLTASVTHPHVVQVFSFGCDQGLYYIAMELVDKGSLDDLMTLQGRIAEAQVLQVGLQIAQGLRAAYQVGLIHRDVKPGNILFSDAHTAKIVDFGLAMPLEQAQEGEAEIWGTPYYVAPEKLNHEPEDFRSDIYSLGGTLFHAISGRPPFEAVNASLVALKHLKSQAVSLQAFAPDVSSPTAYVINRTLAKNPDDRYASYDEFIEHLEYARSQLMENRGQARQARARVVVADQKHQSLLSIIMLVMILLVAGAGVALYMHRDELRTRLSSPEELARLQRENSRSSLEKGIATARKELATGDAQKVRGALEMLAALSGRANLTDADRAVIGLHECVGRLIVGESGKARETVARLATAVAAAENYDPRSGRTGGAPAAQKTNVWTPLFVRLQTALSVEMDSGKAGVAGVSAAPTDAAYALLVGLNEWDNRRFDNAAFWLQQFLDAKPQGEGAWLEAFQPLAKRTLRDATERGKTTAPAR